MKTVKDMEEHERLSKANFTHLNQKSKAIIDDYTQKIFEMLFRTLCAQDTNILDGNNVITEGLPEEVGVLIFPLIEELKEQNETLTGEEFLMACKHLYKTSTLDQKKALCDWYNSNFKPKFNKPDPVTYSFAVIILV